MAQDGNGNNLDLAQILQTLANLPPAPTPSVVQQDQQQPYDPFQSSLAQPSIVSGSYPVHGAVSYGQEQSLDPRLDGRPVPHHHEPLPRPQSRNSTQTIASCTITEWKHGLRCVNKIAMQNPTFVASVQKLMKDQERNVKDWDAGRQRLIEEQEAKRKNEETYRAAVSLPGILDGTAPLRTPEREQEELEQYSKKVYRASQQMVESHSSTLKGLGVPFFGVKPDLVLPDEDESSKSTEDAEPGAKITKRQLLELQRKMLNHLVEMYGD